MRFTQYYGQFQGLRGNIGGVPPWARSILILAAIPGLVVVLAGALLLVAGVLLILLLTLPAYRAMRLFSGRSPTSEPISPAGVDLDSPAESPGRKAVESRIV